MPVNYINSKNDLTGIGTWTPPCLIYEICIFNCMGSGVWGKNNFMGGGVGNKWYNIGVCIEIKVLSPSIWLFLK